MVSLQTPVCEFGKPAPDFDLPGVDGERWGRDACMGDKGLLVMFICNHCPYVKAVLDRIVRDVRELRGHGINAVAIMSNDPTDYPEDSFDNMQRIARENDFPFPYLWTSRRPSPRPTVRCAPRTSSATTPPVSCSIAVGSMPVAKRRRRRTPAATCLRR
jgi:thiol-disulfide isomerase/thioredoxin